MCVNLQARTAGELLKSLAPTQELIALLVTTKCISIAGVAASEDVGQPIGGVMTPAGRVSTTPLARKLKGRNVGGFLLGTELPAPPHGTYSLPEGLRNVASSAGPGSPGRGDEGHGKLTALLPPTERTLAELHSFLATQWPQAPCARWEQWSMHLSESPRLRGYEGCSMSLRFLQHCLDAHEGTMR